MEDVYILQGIIEYELVGTHFIEILRMLRPVCGC